MVLMYLKGEKAVLQQPSTPKLSCSHLFSYEHKEMYIFKKKYHVKTNHTKRTWISSPRERMWENKPNVTDVSHVI